MSRCYAHIYHEHMRTIDELGIQAHLNTSFKHFYYFVSEHKLVEKKDLDPLSFVISELKL